MSKVDDELTRLLRRAERPVDGDVLFEGLARRRSRRERVRRVQAGLLAFAVLAGTGVGFVALRDAFEPDDGGPAVSPSPGVLPSNGEIVFSAGSADGFVHLYAMQQDGSGRRQITDFGTDDTAPAVSPDGRTIAFVHQLEETTPAIATIKLGGGAVTWLTDADHFVTDGPSWSPDGTRITFAATHGEGQRIYVMGADGSDPRPITPPDVYWPHGPAWSPDGTTIAFAASPINRDDAPSVWDIYTVAPDGGALTNVTQTSDRLRDEGGPTWSPDGHRIAFTRNGSDGSSIVIRRLSDGVETQLTDGTFVEGSPAWAPDGRWIAFDRAGVERDPGEHPAQQDLWLVRPDGTGETRLTTDGAFAPTWQPIPPGGVVPSPTESVEPSPSPAPSAVDETGLVEVGLAFPICHASRIAGVDFLGDGAFGIAWVGTRANSDGTCPGNADRYGVAADFSGDGIAESWSGDTIESCVGCEPFKAMDLNGDGRDELIVIQSYFSIMQYGVYTVVPADGQPQIVPFRTGDPGHPQHSLDPGEPFTFWAGGDAGSADWFYCDSLPEIRLTGTESPIDGGPDAETTVHETHVSLGTDGIAHILDAQTYTVVGDVDLQYATSKPDCGLGVDIWRLPAEG